MSLSCPPLSPFEQKIFAALNEKPSFIREDRQQLVDFVANTLGISNPGCEESYVQILPDSDKAMVRISTHFSWELLIACQVSPPCPDRYGVSRIANPKHIGLEFTKGEIDYKEWFAEANPGTPPGGLKVELIFDLEGQRVTRRTETGMEDVPLEDFKQWLIDQAVKNLVAVEGENPEAKESQHPYSKAEYLYHFVQTQIKEIISHFRPYLVGQPVPCFSKTLGDDLIIIKDGWFWLQERLWEGGTLGPADSEATLADNRLKLFYLEWGGTQEEWDKGDLLDLPDTRGRKITCAGQGSGLSDRLIGDTRGEEQHVQTVAEMASHNHGNLVCQTSPYHYGGGGFGIGLRGMGSSGGGQPFNVLDPDIALPRLIFLGVPVLH